MAITIAAKKASKGSAPAIVGKSTEASESVEGQSEAAIVAQFRKLGAKDLSVEK